jgi:hypothetical protein
MRHLRKLSGWEARFKRYTNHVISKELVVVAKGTRRAIVLEDLRGIRSWARALPCETVIFME